ncbi:Potassium channel inwardly rectifying Kir [Trinorchestia longiramus]|nr:Potassium channel inwardly rectifying Kir [Trinorchestia longiramus]
MTKMNNGNPKPKRVQVNWSRRQERWDKDKGSLYRSVLSPNIREAKHAILDDISTAPPNCALASIGHVYGKTNASFENSVLVDSKLRLLEPNSAFHDGALPYCRETRTGVTFGHSNNVSARSSVDLVTSDVQDLIAGVAGNVSLTPRRRWTFGCFGKLLDYCSKKYRYTGAGKKGRKRIVQKNGECNVTVANVAKRRRRYLQDIFTTLVDIKWRWTLMVFALSFILSWLVFAMVWWLIAFIHGDLMSEHLPPNQEKNEWTPCVMNIGSFTSCFLFSIETQHTIGYGSRHTTEECPHAIVVMCLQSITGVVIQAFMVGIVFAKLSRPKKRTQTLIFSRKMCILQRDGQMCLMFRVGDIRKSHIIEAHVRAQLIRKHVTQEGEEIPLHMYDLDVGYDVGEDRIFFIWPMTIVHKIDEGSPLYDLSASALQTADFEIVVLLEGVIESTGMTTQARSSYLPDEILWGHRFQPLVSYKKTPREGFFVDLSLFNNTQPVCTPSCSARELDEERSDSASTGAEGVQENHEDQKDVDGLSEHSSQVTLECPLSPHSVDTMAAAPLMSPSHVCHFNTSNVDKTSQIKQLSFVHSLDNSTLIPSVSQRNLLNSDNEEQDCKPSAFIYDLNKVQNADHALTRSHRHSIALPSRYQLDNRRTSEQYSSKERTHRRAISQLDGNIYSSFYGRKNSRRNSKEEVNETKPEINENDERRQPYLQVKQGSNLSLSPTREDTGISYLRGSCSTELQIKEEPTSPSPNEKETPSFNEGNSVSRDKLDFPSTPQNTNKYCLASCVRTSNSLAASCNNEYSWKPQNRRNSTSYDLQTDSSSPAKIQQTSSPRRSDGIAIAAAAESAFPPGRTSCAGLINRTGSTNDPSSSSSSSPKVQSAFQTREKTSIDRKLSQGNGKTMASPVAMASMWKKSESLLSDIRNRRRSDSPLAQERDRMSEVLQQRRRTISFEEKRVQDATQDDTDSKEFSVGDFCELISALAQDETACNEIRKHIERAVQPDEELSPDYWNPRKRPRFKKRRSKLSIAKFFGESDSHRPSAQKNIGVEGRRKSVCVSTSIQTNSGSRNTTLPVNHPTASKFCSSHKLFSSFIKKSSDLDRGNELKLKEKSPTISGAKKKVDKMMPDGTTHSGIYRHRSNSAANFLSTISQVSKHRKPSLPDSHKFSVKSKTHGPNTSIVDPTKIVENSRNLECSDDLSPTDTPRSRQYKRRFLDPDRIFRASNVDENQSAEASSIAIHENFTIFRSTVKDGVKREYLSWCSESEPQIQDRKKRRSSCISTSTSSPRLRPVEAELSKFQKLIKSSRLESPMLVNRRENYLKRKSSHDDRSPSPGTNSSLGGKTKFADSVFGKYTGVIQSHIDEYELKPPKILLNATDNDSEVSKFHFSDSSFRNPNESEAPSSEKLRLHQLLQDAANVQYLSRVADEVQETSAERRNKVDVSSSTKRPSQPSIFLTSPSERHRPSVIASSCEEADLETSVNSKSHKKERQSRKNSPSFSHYNADSDVVNR